MPILTTTRNYDDGEVLVRADLDAFLDDIESFLNAIRINDDNIQNSGINGATKLLNASVTEAKLATNAVTTLKIADGAVIEGKLASSSVTEVKIGTGAVTETKIGASAVTEAKLANDAVTADKLSDSVSVDSVRAVTTNHIRDAAVTTPKIADSAVTTDKINAGAVNASKLSNVLQGALTVTTTVTRGTGTWEYDVPLSGTTTCIGGRASIALISGFVATTNNGDGFLKLQYDTGSGWTDFITIYNGAPPSSLGFTAPSGLSSGVRWGRQSTLSITGTTDSMDVQPINQMDGMSVFIVSSLPAGTASWRFYERRAHTGSFTADYRVVIRFVEL